MSCINVYVFHPVMTTRWPKYVGRMVLQSYLSFHNWSYITNASDKLSRNKQDSSMIVHQAGWHRRCHFWLLSGGHWFKDRPGLRYSGRVFHGFSQSLHEKDGTVSRVRFHLLLLHYLPFIITIATNIFLSDAILSQLLTEALSKLYINTKTWPL